MLQLNVLQNGRFGGSRTLRISSVLVLFLGFFFVGALRAENKPMRPDNKITSGSMDHYEAFPDILRLKDGKLFLVFYAGRQHIGPIGAIACSQSEDDGLTWSEPRVLYDGPNDDRDPSIFQTKEGTLLCSFMNDIDRGKMPAMTVQILRSEDGGKTWSGPIDIESPFKKLTACSSPMIQLANGDLLLPVYGRETENGFLCDTPGQRDRAAVVYSHDDGKTWTDPVVIDENPVQLHEEPSLCLLPSGRIYCMLRTRGGMTWSDDNGQTWSPVRYLNWNLDCPYLFPVSEKVILCGMRNRDHHPSITMAVSIDGGETWSDPQFMDEGNGAYPSIQKIRDNLFIFVYYRDETGPSRIHRTYFQVDKQGVVQRLTIDEAKKELSK